MLLLLLRMHSMRRRLRWSEHMDGRRARGRSGWIRTRRSCGRRVATGLATRRDALGLSSRPELVVDFGVSLLLVRPSKLSPTGITRKGLFARMRPHVRRQVVGPRE